MPESVTLEGREDQHGTATRPSGRDRYFLAMAVLMIVLNVVGFAPSYFLKSFFDGPELPPYMHIHGAMFMSWFVLFFIQMWMIESRNVALHKKLGIAGAVLACGMVLSALTVLYFLVMEYHEFGGDLAVRAAVVWGNLALLTGFTTFVTLGFVFRSRPAAHKRLMLLASLSMMPQALGRMGRFEALRLNDSFFVNEAVYGLGGLVLLLVSLVIHDIVVRGRPHPAVMWGAPLFFGSIVVIGLVVPNTEFGQALILMFG